MDQSNVHKMKRGLQQDVDTQEQTTYGKWIVINLGKSYENLLQELFPKVRALSRHWLDSTLKIIE